MALRIHKIIGYGARHSDPVALELLLDDNSKKGEVAALFDAIPDYEKDMDHIINSKSFWEGHPHQNYPETFSDIVHYATYSDNEDGYWVITPPIHFESWYRWDDEIDYIEQIQSQNPEEEILNFLPRGIYPYSEDWMDASTGNKVKLEDDRSPPPDGVVPMVPPSIRAIAEHLKFDFKTLRPVYGVWWN